MDERLQRLLDALWEHDLPLGPFGDFDLRQQAERQWEASLTADDCLALLNWIERRQLPPHWEPTRERWLLGLTDRAAWHAGRIGHRTADSRITHRLVELLAIPDCRSAALEGLAELADPTAFDSLLGCLGDQLERLNVCVALAASATPEQVERLRNLAASAPTPELRGAATEVVAEWEAVRQEQKQPEPVAPSRPTCA